MFRLYASTYLATFLLQFMATADAAVITIEGTVKSVDGKSRTITVETSDGAKALDVSSKAKVAANGKEAAFDSLKSGQRVKLSYHDGLEVVLSIDVASIAFNEVRRFAGHSSPVMSVAVHPNGRTIASCGADRTIRVWNLAESSDEHVLLPHPVARPPKILTWVAFSSNGKLLASSGGDGSIRVWETSETTPQLRETLDQHHGLVTPLAFSPDGKLLASAERNTGTIRLWNLVGDKAVPMDVLSSSNRQVWSLAFSPNSFELIAGYAVVEKGTEVAGEVWKWELSKAPFTKNVIVEGMSVLPRSLSYSPDGTKIAYAEMSVVRVIDSDSGRQIHSLVGSQPNKPVISVAFSPDGKHLLSGGYDDTISLWDMTTGKQIAAVSGEFRGVEQLAFMPDGHSAVSATKDGIVRLWKLPQD